jgi:hypothetical protein
MKVRLDRFVMKMIFFELSRVTAQVARIISATENCLPGNKINNRKKQNKKLVTNTNVDCGQMSQTTVVKSIRVYPFIQTEESKNVINSQPILIMAFISILIQFVFFVSFPKNF